MSVIGEHVDTGPIDWTRTFFNNKVEYPVYPGQVISDLGLPIVAANDGGVLKVREATGAGTDVWMGCALIDTRTIATWPLVESLVIPAAPGPYTLQLSRSNIVGAFSNSSVYIYDNTDSGAMTEVNVTPTVTNTFQVNYTTGVITFYSAEAEHSITVQYRYNMTVAERQARFQEDHVNLGASALYNQIAVGQGPGQLYTIQYDTSVDYSALPEVLTYAKNGMAMFSTAGSGMAAGRVIKAPSVDDPFLGIQLYEPKS